MSQSSKAAPKYKHAAHAAWRRVESEAIILDLNSSEYFSLNDTGARIWERLGAGASPDLIAEELCVEYSVEPEEASRDVAQIVARLVKEKLLIPG
jgi:hypothetical protein